MVSVIAIDPVGKEVAAKDERFSLLLQETTNYYFLMGHKEEEQPWSRLHISSRGNLACHPSVQACPSRNNDLINRVFINTLL